MEKNKLYLKAIEILIKQSHNVSTCDFCINQIPCLSKQCSDYIEGVGDAEGKWPDLKWSCEDFVFGTCPKLEKTPCYQCIENHCSNFKLNQTSLEQFVKDFEQKHA